MPFLITQLPFDETAVKRRMTETNEETTARSGLILTPEQITELCGIYKRNLLENKIVEFNAGGVVKIQKVFAESDFVDNSNYYEVVETMAEAFYYLKREVNKEVRDDTVIKAMFEAFDRKCMGSLELFQSRELEALIRYINEGRSSLEIVGDDDYDSEPEVPTFN